MATTFTPVIPEKVTVHLGAPNSNAPNVTVSFADYIKNVASTEIYPTWNEEALRANILAQISYTLNRIYTNYYRSRGYDFDITNDTSRDQSFIAGRDIFENVSRLVDELFTSYLRREGSVEPLFAVYCDGLEVTCGGLSQWGSEELAKQGYTAERILKRYYGENIEIVRNVPVEGSVPSAPIVPLRRGSANPYVQILQVRLNRIARDYPAIPRIPSPDGVFGQATEDAVRAFQGVFGLRQDGVVGSGTWYAVSAIFTAVKRLSDLASEGLRPEEVTSRFPRVLRRGDRGQEVRVLQYYLNYVGQFIDSVPSPIIDGDYGENTERAVRAFQSAYGLTPDGVVGEITWDRLVRAYLGMVENIPLIYTEGVTVPFPGTVLKMGSEGEDVRLLQSYLNYIARTYPSIPTVTADGYFGSATAAQVEAFVRQFGITPGLPGVVASGIWDAVTSVYRSLWLGAEG